MFTPFSSVSIIDFEQVNVSWEVQQIALTSSRYVWIFYIFENMLQLDEIFE